MRVSRVLTTRSYSVAGAVFQGIEVRGAMVQLLEVRQTRTKNRVSRI